MEQADPANNIFLVEKLLDRRWRKNRAEYLVKWLGYPETETTWEPRANINPVLVEQFDAERGGPLTAPSPRGAKRKIAQSASSSAASSAASSSTTHRRGGRAPPKPRDENPPNRSRRRRQNETGASEQDLTTSSSNAEEAEAEEEPQPKKPRSSDLGSPAKPTESPKVPKDNGTPVEKPSVAADQPTPAAEEAKPPASTPEKPSAGATQEANVAQKREIPTINLPSDDDDDIAIIETVQRTETTVVQDADGNSSVTTKTVTETIEEDDCQVIYEEQPAASNSQASGIGGESSGLDEPMDLGSSDAAASSSLDQVAPISIPQIVEIKETTIASSTVTFGGDQPESNGERATSVVETRQTIEIIEPAARPEESTSTSASASDSFARANRATVTEVTAAGRTVQIIEYSRASERNGNFD